MKSNFLTRTLSGFVFLVVVVFGLIWDRTLFGALSLVVLYFCLKEFYTISLGERFSLQQKLGLLSGLVAFTLVAGYFFYGWDISFLSIALIPLLLIPVSCLLTGLQDDFSDIAVIYAGLLYIALPIVLSPIMVMDGEIYDGWLLLTLIILIWISDIGAYCLGTLFGQRPGSRRLAPSISPHKSWWGFWSGLAFCVAAAIGLHFLGWLPFPIWHCIALGFIISLGGLCGDLFESMWKRHFNVKDSGKAIPGHGGMLDRFDSTLVAVPMAAVYLSLFGLI